MDEQILRRVLTEVMDEQLPAKIDGALDRVLPSKIDAALERVLPSKIDEALERALPSKIDEALERVLPSKIDEALERVLPSKIDEALQRVLPVAIDEALERALPDKIAKALDEQLPAKIVAYDAKVEQRFHELREALTEFASGIQRQIEELRQENSRFWRQFELFRNDTEGSLLRCEKRLNDHNWRLATVEEELRLAHQA
ncbi:MAG: hypothetical protein K6T63_13445 [Alicyclobacillus herbarius]|uniref:hypothetical protein n=1 Tax=Alicyclobacillus herbarius TaxID=122960 RepID=UPI0023540EB9|nr:hypothetical protein [Alicyclobacillus herbarius]MCL6633621.1 hypothetical protein [Alicyclobacillus herbarius]